MHINTRYVLILIVSLVYACTSTENQTKEPIIFSTDQQDLQAESDSQTYEQSEEEGLAAIYSAMEANQPNSESSREETKAILISDSAPKADEENYEKSNDFLSAPVISQPPGDFSMVFPNYTTPWAIKSYIISNTQPDESLLAKCQETLDKMAEASNSSEDLLVSSSQFKTIASQDLPLHHWCYFHTLKQLDENIEKARVTIDVKMNSFIFTMNKLWISASAMTDLTQNPQYSSIAKDRYIKYSEKYFGRVLKTIGRPMTH